MSDEKDTIDNEEVVEDENDDETGDDETPEGDEPKGEEPKAEKPKEETPKQEDVKEHNRKGYDQRHKNDKGVSREEFDGLKSTVTTITEENKDLKFRNAHPNMSDEAFNSLKAFAKGSGKDYDEAMKDPVFKAGLEALSSKERVSGATSSAPSTKTNPGSSSPDWKNMSSEEFAEKRNAVLTRRSD